MKSLLIFTLMLVSTVLCSQESSLVESREDGRYTLSMEGASYFANLSLECTGKIDPHYVQRVYKNRYVSRLSLIHI